MTKTLVLLLNAQRAGTLVQADTSVLTFEYDASYRRSPTPLRSGNGPVG